MELEMGERLSQTVLTVASRPCGCCAIHGQFVAKIMVSLGGWALPAGGNARWASQRSFHNEPIFRLLLKVAVKGAHECELRNISRDL